MANATHRSPLTYLADEHTAHPQSVIRWKRNHDDPLWKQLVAYKGETVAFVTVNIMVILHLIDLYCKIND